MRNNQRYYLAYVLIGLLVLDAVAANIKIDTSRGMRKTNKGMALRGGNVYEQPRKHIALTNRKIFVAMRDRSAGYGGEAGEGCKTTYIYLSDTFDTITNKTGIVDTIVTRLRDVDYITVEKRAVGTMGKTKVNVGVVTQVPIRVDTLANYEVEFQQTKSLPATIQVLHSVPKTIWVLEKVHKTIQTLVPIRVTLGSLYAENVEVAEVTERQQLLHTVTNQGAHMPEVTLRNITIQQVAPTQVKYRVEHSKQVPYYYQESTCRSMAEITQERVNVVETTSVGFCETRPVCSGENGEGAEY